MGSEGKPVRGLATIAIASYTFLVESCTFTHIPLLRWDVLLSHFHFAHQPVGPLLGAVPMYTPNTAMDRP